MAADRPSRSRRLFVAVLLALPMAPHLSGQGIRIVDRVVVGDPSSDREHEYDGSKTADGTIDGAIYRQARGWISYSLRIYEDTDVTLACTFRGTDGASLDFELQAEGKAIGRFTVSSPSAAPLRADYRVPFSLTKGLTAVRVTFRAVDGPTPGLIELRTLQEHLERPESPSNPDLMAF